jgi:transcriptional regulator with XRE-family HTH domain
MLKMGSVLKRARQEKGMTLEDLSSKCGYSKALISRIENDSVSPSISSLTKMSQALNLKLYDIFAEIEVEEPLILRKDDREKFWVPNGRYEVEFLTTGSSTKMMQPLIVSLESGAEAPGGLISHRGEKFLLVLEGTLEVAVGEERRSLKSGDSIRFRSTAPSRLANIGKTKSVSVAVMYPPYY